MVVPPPPSSSSPLLVRVPPPWWDPVPRTRAEGTTTTSTRRRAERTSSYPHKGKSFTTVLALSTTTGTNQPSSSSSSSSSSSQYPSSEDDHVDSTTSATETSRNNNNNNLLDLESPFTYAHEDDEDHDLSPALSGFFYGQDQSSLLNVTTQFLSNEQMYPLGKLSTEDVEAITGLMGAWTKQRTVDAALQIELLLKRLVDDMKAGNTDITIRTQHYVLLLDAWSKSNAPGAAERAQMIHDKMTEEYEQTKNLDIRPSVLSNTILINAWAKSNETHAPTMANRILQNMVNAYRNHGEMYLKPDAVTFSTIMESYSRSPVVSGPEAVQKCEELFALMDELGVRKNVYTYSALQNVYARSGLPNALQRAMELLQSMLELYTNGDMNAKPNCRNYNAVLNAASRTGTLQSAQLARQLLTQMETSTQDGGYDIEPDRVSYTLTILACSRIPNRTMAAEMALSTLEQMEDKAQQEEQRRQQVSSVAPPVVRLDVETFNVVLTTLSRVTGDDAFDAETKIRNLLSKMHKYATEGYISAQPNTRSYNTLLNFLARSGPKPEAGQSADKVLRSMFRMHQQDGLPDILPNPFSFAAVLTAYQRDATVAAADAADTLVQEMEELYEAGIIDSPPDVYHYTILTGVWAKSEQGQKAADRSLEILAHMMERNRNGYPHVQPNCRTYNAVLDCLARADDGDRVEALLYYMLKCYKDGDEEAKPDSFSFNCAISAFTRSKKPGSGRRAESILDRFLEYQENENPSALPDARSFANIIAHYGRSRWLSGTGSKSLDSPYRAEYVLNRMVNYFKDGRDYLEPNTFAITTVIDSYAYAKHPDAGTNAERLLQLVTNLREKYGAKRLAITTAMLNSVLFAW
jgi:pentatricopeptide repeat protein